MLHHYLKIALRNLWKYKSQTLIGVLGLATACVVFSIICYLLYFTLSQNTVYPNHERMYELRTRNYQTSIRGNMKSTLSELSGVEKFTFFKHSNLAYGRLLMEGNEPGHPRHFQLTEADTSVWNFFSIKPLLGNVQTILNTPNSIVLYEDAAKKIGKVDELQGRSIIFDDVTYTITGILKNRHIRNKYLGVEGLVFNQENGFFRQNHETWQPISTNVIIMLRKGISKSQFQTVLNAYPFVFDADQNSDFKEQVYISSTNGVSEYRVQQILILTMVFAIGLMVLLVALFNIISFQTAQFYNRLKECAIRKLVGAGKGQLLLSFYMEIIIVFVLSCILGIMIIDLLKPVVLQTTFGSIITAEMVSEIKLQFLLSVIFGLVITFLFCLVPVQMISRRSVNVVFKGLSEKVSKQRGRKIMLFVQMFVMLIFLSATLIVRLQINSVKERVWHTLSTEDRKNIFSFGYNFETMPKGMFDVIMQQLKQLSAIDDVFLTNTYLLYGNLYGKVTVNERENLDVRGYEVSHNFASFFNAKMVMGRFWEENDAPNVMVVDEFFASFYPDNNPLGMRFFDKTIIGVVENIQMQKENQDFRHNKRPVFYSPVKKTEGISIFVKAIDGKREEAEQHIIQIKKEFYPEDNQMYSDFHTYVGYILFEEDMYFRLLGIFSVICMILCLLSIYSAITMNTEKRRKEVAIRKINGAEIKDIILLFSKTYILLWSVVCVLVFPVIYFAGNLWLETFSRRISLNVFFFSGIYFSVLVLIFLIVIFRIMEVARCNPAEVVKSE